MLVDLSVQLNNQTPAYPGDPKIQIAQIETVESDGHLGHSILLGTHTGTHIDAPAHMLVAGDSLGAVPIDRFFGTGKLVDAFTIDAIDKAMVESDNIVIFYTGMSNDYYKPSYFTDYPVMPGEIADYLINKGVKLVGVDTCSVDNTPDFPIHKRLLGAGIPIAENLTNLDALQDRNFQVYAFPLNLDLDGAPARVIAETDDNG